MKRIFLAVGVIAILASGLLAQTTKALPAGDSKTIGWRGDGSGVYPTADPPTEWQSVSPSIAALRCRATIPAAAAVKDGKSMNDGVAREWFVHEPLDDARDAKKMPADPLFSEDQAKFEESMAWGSTGWKAVSADTAFIDFAKLFDNYGKAEAKATYAHTCIYSPAEATFVISLNHSVGSVHLWVNGKLTHKAAEMDLNYSPQTVKLNKGWNTLMVRVGSRPGAVKDPPVVGTWYFSLVLRAMPGAAANENKNIAWKTALPSGDGFGGPIVVDGKIFLQSETADLVCLDAKTGKILWVRSNNYDELATPAERQANVEVFTEIAPLETRLKEINDSFASASPPKMENVEGRDIYKEKTTLEKKLYALMRKVDDKKYLLPKGQDVGYSGLTPVSDGKRVWAWFATGVTACYDLKGECLWRRLDNEGSFFEHGYSVSPVLSGNRLIVYMNKLIGFDADKGERVWTAEFESRDALRFHGTPAIAKIGQTPVCVLPSGHVVRVEDGQVLRAKGSEFIGLQQEIPSPVVVGDTVWRLSTYSRLFRQTLPAEITEPLKMDIKEAKVDVTKYPTSYLEWFLASPLVHDGLVYAINNSGVLVVFDAKTMEVVYQKFLDLDPFQNANEGASRGIGISPSLAGGNIYLVGNSGSTLVIKPGRVYEQIAKNKIESLVRRNWGVRTERFVACPTFDGPRMYIRGEHYLYCVSKDAQPSSATK